jgi:hypothetical protein
LSSRRTAVTLGVAAVLPLLFAGCVAAPIPGASSTAAETAPGPTPTLAPGNESTAKGEPPAPVAVEPVIVYAGFDAASSAFGASGYIAGVIENGGTCTFTFTGPSSTETVTSEGAADVSTTSCGNVELDPDAVTSGSWSVSLSYQSDATPAVTSTPSTVEVP